MAFTGDYHTHSRYSDGRQSIQEIVQVAERKGLKEVAITDHGPMAVVIGVKNEDSYRNIQNEIEKLQKSNPSDMRVLMGAEANIRGIDGKLDIRDELICDLDVVIAGLHPYTRPSALSDIRRLWIQNSLRHMGRHQREKAVNENTKATLAALYNNPRLDILSHPGLFFRVDVEEVARACIKNDVLFEINCGHEHPSLSDIMIADKIGVEFIVNSDAHFTESVGAFEYGENAMNHLQIEPDRIKNWT